MLQKIKLPAAVEAIYIAVDELQRQYPDRKFTPDGHMVGSIGEVIAKEAFGLKLFRMSAPVHDAYCKQRGDVQIKTTGGDGVQVKQCNHLLVLKIDSPQEASVIYDGPGIAAWKIGGAENKAGERWVSIKKLLALNTKNQKQ